MPGALVYGETNNGKTALALRFLSLHPPINEPQNDCALVPALYVQAPPAPDEGRLLSAILEVLCSAPVRRSMRIDQREFQVIRLLKMLSVQMLLVDEIQNVDAGTDRQKRSFFQTLKYLGNELRIPVVIFGTTEACSALNSDRQLANRFDRLPLPKWKPSTEFLRLLASFGRILPLRKPSQLTEATLAIQIYKLSEGTIGEIATVIKQSAIFAIRSGDEHITAETVKSIPYVPPSRRKSIDIS